jgi:UDP-2-acetamido-2-deoxy-ribo-hexuluronate aminotransferase
MENREQLQEQLKAAGIPTAVHYPIPINEQPAYRHLCCPDCTPIASKTAKRVMSLPMSVNLTEEQRNRITRTLCA